MTYDLLKYVELKECVDMRDWNLLACVHTKNDVNILASSVRDHTLTTSILVDKAYKNCSNFFLEKKGFALE